mmetsp:Transcript_36944/g.86571  ORF Transcript_36944/g.86571 Transcript_36944/m.86571 type:complete len:220 (+) Transcript_36944:1347-2006(+)
MWPLHTGRACATRRSARTSRACRACLADWPHWAIVPNTPVPSRLSLPPYVPWGAPDTRRPQLVRTGDTWGTSSPGLALFPISSTRTRCAGGPYPASKPLGTPEPYASLFPLDPYQTWSPGCTLDAHLALLTVRPGGATAPLSALHAPHARGTRGASVPGTTTRTGRRDVPLCLAAELVDVLARLLPLNDLVLAPPDLGQDVAIPVSRLPPKRGNALLEL